MTNALTDLQRKWWEREAAMLDEIIMLTAPGDLARECRENELVVHRRCMRELSGTLADLQPPPLNEASTEKLYKHADKLVAIFDLMIEARDMPDDVDAGEDLTCVANKLGELADRPFVNDLYDLFKQLGNRRRGV